MAAGRMVNPTCRCWQFDGGEALGAKHELLAQGEEGGNGSALEFAAVTSKLRTSYHIHKML